MYPHVIKRWNLSWCNTQNAGIVKHGVMGDKRKIRTPKVRESFFKPMNLLARFEWKFNQCTYLFNHYLLRGNQIKSREAQIKNLTRKEHGHHCWKEIGDFQIICSKVGGFRPFNYLLGVTCYLLSLKCKWLVLNKLCNFTAYKLFVSTNKQLSDPMDSMADPLFSSYSVI